MTNVELFEFSGRHPEPIIDPYYNRYKVVIPATAEQTNLLVEKNARLIELISVFGYFIGMEVIDFIRYAEADTHIHYITYLDGEYSNLLHGETTQPKIRRQYDDAVSCLKNNPGNYFLNTAGFEEFVREITL